MYLMTAILHPHINMGVKIRKNEELLLSLCQDLTKVESRHDSANHASMLALAAPRLENY